MSDIAQGALIGIAGTIGTIIGVLITGIISYKIAKQQISASHETINKQLKHKEKEIKIDNLIKAREKVLIPLREALGSSLTLANNALILMVQMGEANKESDKDELRKAIQRWEEASHKSSEADTELNKLRSQIDDSQLDRMIDEVMISKEQEDVNVIELVVRAHQPESRNIDTIRSIQKDLKIIRKRIFNKLLPVNKRIVELLSGEPSA
jgi:hypothetical protein